MKKYLKYYLIVLIVSLPVLVYLQWFSPSAPIEYIPSTSNEAPKELKSLPTIDLDGNEGVIDIGDSEITLLITTQYNSESEEYNKFSPYYLISPINERLEGKGIRVVYLWLNQEDDIGLIKEYIKDDQASENYLLNNRMLNEYKKHGITVRTTLIAAYDQQGELIYYKFDQYIPLFLRDEIIQGLIK